MELYIRSPRNSVGQWGFVLKWQVPFATNTLKTPGYFVSGFDHRPTHPMDVYLPRSDHAEVLPYAELRNLAGRLREAQRTGHMFNAEINVQNLESYRQLAAVAQAYDPHSPETVRYYAQNIFRYLSMQHDDLQGILRKLSDSDLDSTTRDSGLAQMLFILQIPASDSASWQERRDLIQSRLDSDSSIIKNVPKPE